MAVSIDAQYVRQDLTNPGNIYILISSLTHACSLDAHLVPSLLQIDNSGAIIWSWITSLVQAGEA
jgi:hypothetical protein